MRVIWICGTWAILTSCWAVLVGPQCVAAAGIEADILLVGGRLMAGDGQPATQGNVAIRGDEIVAVGTFAVESAKRTIDCRDHVVCPGFIDLHNHSDKPIVDRKTRSALNYLTQGCTTLVTGNCGSGPIDVAEYYRQIDEHGAGTNVAHLIPQGALRREVLGDQRKTASDADLKRMRELTDRGMRAGAWGMSSGLIYVPSSYADTAELIAIAEVVGRHQGVYASHIRNEGMSLLDAVEEALQIGREADVHVHISHFKSSGQDAWGLVRTAVKLIEKARQDGRVVTADQYPYTASSTSLGATFIPAWARAGGRKKMLARLDGGAEAERIRKAIEKKLEITDDGQRVQIASYTHHPTWTGLRLKEIADREQITPLELIMNIERNGGASVVNHSINEEDVRFVMSHAWVATASDGSARIPDETMPHPRSYGTFPRKLGHYSVRQHAISLEHAVRSATGLPADIMQLPDRGYLKAGQRADICVWDPQALIDLATFEKPHQYSRGMQYVFVNGVVTIEAGSPTGALAGRALRKRTSQTPQ